MLLLLLLLVVVVVVVVLLGVLRKPVTVAVCYECCWCLLLLLQKVNWPAATLGRACCNCC
jgi:hypothetical protein